MKMGGNFSKKKEKKTLQKANMGKEFFFEKSQHTF